MAPVGAGPYGGLLMALAASQTQRAKNQVAQLHFAPTAQSAKNLQASGVVGEIYTTGNTVIDALLLMAAAAPSCEVPGLDWQKQKGDSCHSASP